MPETDQGDFDEEFLRSIVAWRERHRLREDDAVLLLIELFRIHQQHWDELRRRELPSFEQFRSDIVKLSEASRAFQQQAAGLIQRLHAIASRRAGVSRPAAVLAALVAGFAGYFLGRAWP